MKRGTPTHPKTAKLARELGVSLHAAVGVLEMLWHWAARYAPQGNVGKYDDPEIAKGILWEGDATTLTAALVATGWLDSDPEYRLVIHDWRDHADEAVKKVLHRAKLDFIGETSRCRRDAVATPADETRQPVARLGSGSYSCFPSIEDSTEEAKNEPTPTRARAESNHGASAPDPPGRNVGLLIPSFEQFWGLVPNQQNRRQAALVWNQLGPADRQSACEAMNRQRAWPRYVAEGFRYMPRPDRWLQDRRWEDREPATSRAPRSARNLEAADEALRRMRERDAQGGGR